MRREYRRPLCLCLCVLFRSVFASAVTILQNDRYVNIAHTVSLFTRRLTYCVFQLILIYVRPYCCVVFGCSTTDGVLLSRTHQGLQKRNYPSMPHTLITRIHVYCYFAHTTILQKGYMKRHDVFESGCRFKIKS